MGDIRRQRSHLALSFAHLIRTHGGSGASWTCLDHQYRYTATDRMLSVPQMFRLEERSNAGSNLSGLFRPTNWLPALDKITE